MSNSTLLIVVLLAGISMVITGLAIARVLSPKSNNFSKGEPYECGIPTRGTSWQQFNVGYYIFAILYLIFDVESVMLFPWASIMRDLGLHGLICVSFFFVILTLGLAYAWKKEALKWD